MEVSSANNFKNPESGMEKYGKQRLELAVVIRDNILHKDMNWTIENGTLLGAWRNGKFIQNDDDFDFAVFFPRNAENQMASLMEHIKNVLPQPYRARLVTSYCCKIEVYDPTHGKYTLKGPSYNGADYHHVTVDIQAYEKKNNGTFHSLYYAIPQGIELNAEDIFPIDTITLEGQVFNAPCNVEAVLRNIYGSLSENARYNRCTGRYEDSAEEAKD